jgi:hypothetical protein
VEPRARKGFRAASRNLNAEAKPSPVRRAVPGINGSIRHVAATMLIARSVRILCQVLSAGQCGKSNRTNSPPSQLFHLASKHRSTPPAMNSIIVNSMVSPPSVDEKCRNRSYGSPPVLFLHASLRCRIHRASTLSTLHARSRIALERTSRTRPIFIFAPASSASLTESLS